MVTRRLRSNRDQDAQRSSCHVQLARRPIVESRVRVGRSKQLYDVRSDARSKKLPSQAEELHWQEGPRAIRQSLVNIFYLLFGSDDDNDASNWPTSSTVTDFILFSSCQSNNDTSAADSVRKRLVSTSEHSTVMATHGT
jgi:hypothetical protein